MGEGGLFYFCWWSDIRLAPVGGQEIILAPDVWLLVTNFGVKELTSKLIGVSAKEGFHSVVVVLGRWSCPEGWWSCPEGWWSCPEGSCPEGWWSFPRYSHKSSAVFLTSSW